MLIYTILSKYHKLLRVVGLNYERNSFVAEAHTVKRILIAVNGYPVCVTALSIELVVCGTVIVSGTLSKLNPLTINYLTVLIELVRNLCTKVVFKGLFGNCCECGLIEVVPLTVKIEPSTGENTESGEVPVTVDLNKTVVLALRYTIVIKVIVYTVNFNDTCYCNAVYVIAVFYPALNNLTEVVELAVGINTAEELAAIAHKYAVNEVIGMACSGDGSTPVYNRVTTVTEGSAGVACGCTCCCNVCNCICSMEMSAIPCVMISFSCGTGAHLGSGKPHFCVTEYSLTGEGINCIVCSYENTAVNVSDNRHLPVFPHRSELCESKCLSACLCTVFVLIAGLKSPYAHGHRNESCLACSLNVTCLGNGDGSNVIAFVDSIGSFETVGNDHMIELPLAVVVKVDVNLNRLNCCDIGSNEIHPVDGVELDAVLRRIVRYELNCAVGVSCVNCNVTDGGSIVAHLVLC